MYHNAAMNRACPHRVLEVDPVSGACTLLVETGPSASPWPARRARGQAAGLAGVAGGRVAGQALWQDKGQRPGSTCGPVHAERGSASGVYHAESGAVVGIGHFKRFAHPSRVHLSGRRSSRFIL